MEHKGKNKAAFDGFQENKKGKGSEDYKDKEVDSDIAALQEEVDYKYKITNQIGAGSYGNVYEAIEKDTERKVAIKSIHSIFDDLVDCKRIMREIKILRRLNCPYAVKLLDIIPPNNRYSFNRLHIVLEYADSDLKKLLKSSLKLEEIHVKTLMYNFL